MRYTKKYFDYKLFNYIFCWIYSGGDFTASISLCNSSEITCLLRGKKSHPQKKILHKNFSKRHDVHKLAKKGMSAGYMLPADITPVIFSLAYFAHRCPHWFVRPDKNMLIDKTSTLQYVLSG